MSYISQTEKYSHLHSLVQLAKSEGKLSMPELSYLIWVAKKLELSEEEVKVVFGKDDVPYDPPLNQKERLVRFHRVLNMMFVDTHIDPEELVLCEELGEKMGLEKSGVTKIISAIKVNPKKMVHLEELEKIFGDV